MSQEAVGLVLELTEGCQPHFPWLAASEKNLTPGSWKQAFCFLACLIFLPSFQTPAAAKIQLSGTSFGNFVPMP
jgi:hypothetical protein